MPTTVVLVQYRVQPDRIDAATRAIRALVDTVLSTEPDCGGISVLRNGADPARITLVETWPSREVFLGPHMQQPHIQAFIQSASALLASPPDLSFWERIDGRATPA